MLLLLLLPPQGGVPAGLAGLFGAANRALSKATSSFIGQVRLCDHHGVQDPVAVGCGLYSHMAVHLCDVYFFLGVFVTREHVRHNKSGIAHRGRTGINHLRELPTKLNHFCSSGQVTLPNITREPKVCLWSAGCRDAMWCGWICSCGVCCCGLCICALADSVQCVSPNLRV
jgi:hypothetical protein